MDLMKFLDNLNLKGYQIVIGTLLIIAIVVTVFYSFLTYQIKQSEIEQTKPIYWHTKDTVSGVVSETNRVTRGHGIGVTFKDGSKKKLGWAENGLYGENSELWDFIQIGDSLHKNKADDSIHIYRHDQYYYFIISQRLNMEIN